MHLNHTNTQHLPTQPIQSLRSDRRKHTSCTRASTPITTASVTTTMVCSSHKRARRKRNVCVYLWELVWVDVCVNVSGMSIYALHKGLDAVTATSTTMMMVCSSHKRARRKWNLKCVFMCVCVSRCELHEYECAAPGYRCRFFYLFLLRLPWRPWWCARATREHTGEETYVCMYVWVLVWCFCVICVCACMVALRRASYPFAN